MTSLLPPVLADLLRDSLTQGQPATLQVTSNSMAPLLLAGDTIQLAALARPPQPGQIITFLSEGSLQTHRLWRREGDQYLARGNRPLQFDPPVSETDMVGQVVGRTRNGRFLSFTGRPGRWLNHYLWTLARLEGQLFGGQNGQRLVVRLLRRGLYSLASGATTVVNLTAVVKSR